MDTYNLNSISKNKIKRYRKCIIFVISLLAGFCLNASGSHGVNFRVLAVICCDI